MWINNEDHVRAKPKEQVPLLFWLILLIGIAIRVVPIPDLTVGSLSYNEGLTLRAAAQPVLDGGLQPGSPDQAFLRFFILHFFLYFGRGEFLIRLPALLFGIGTIALIYKAGKEFFDKSVGLMSAFLLSVSLWHIHHSTYAGMYTLYAFLSLLSVYFFFQALVKGRLPYWVGFVAATTLAGYSFYPLFTLLAAEIFVFLFFHRAFRTSYKKMAVSLIFIGGLLAPAVPFLIKAIRWKSGYGDYQWGMLPLESLSEIFFAFNGIKSFYFFFPAALFILGVGASFFRKERRFQIILLFSAVVVSSLIVVAAALFRINLAERYFLFSYPFFLILIAWGISILRIKILKILIFLAVNLPLGVFLFSWTVPTHRNLIPWDHMRHYGRLDLIAEYLVLHYQEGDAIVIEHDPGMLAIQYYLDKENLNPVKKVRFASCRSCNHYRYNGERIKNVFGLTEWDGSPQRLQNLARFYKRLWLVDLNQLHYFDKKGEIAGWVSRNAVSKADFSDGVIYLLVNQQKAEIDKEVSNDAICFPEAPCVTSDVKIIPIVYPFNKIR